MMIKNILNNVYGIRETYIVDNRISKFSFLDNIISLDELIKKIVSGSVIFICSDNENIYGDIRASIRQLCDNNVIIDLFSYSMFFDKDVYSDQTYLNGAGLDARHACLEQAAREIYKNKIDGSTAEAGVFQGDFAKYIARLLPDRKLYLFDTFNGFPAEDISKEDSNIINFKNEVGDFSDTSISIVKKNVGEYVDLIIRKGYFPETAIGLEDERFCFVSLDMDLYKPIKAGLEFFYPRMNKGGVHFCA